MSNIELREVIESDLPIFFENQRDPESVAMVGLPSRDHDAFVAHWAKVRANPENMVRTILFDDQVAGNVLSFTMEDKRWVGYWLGREFWGKGIATQALAAYLNIDTRRPLYAHVLVTNTGSRRVLEKCGFTLHAELNDPDPLYELILP
jgi:RimJ/RimL family protein N-acetyltransferase